MLSDVILTTATTHSRAQNPIHISAQTHLAGKWGYMIDD